MTRARWKGLAVIVLWLVAGIGWLPFGALSAIVPPVSMLYWTTVGLPVYVITWFWLRTGLTPAERWIMVAGGVVWLLLDLAVAVLFLHAPISSTLQYTLTLTWMYFPPIAVLLFGALTVARWLRLPREDSSGAVTPSQRPSST